jgi:uncharacterized radical SAM superfamily protein
MIDIIGSTETLKTVYHLDVTDQVFESSLNLLEQNEIPIVPHILVGINFGKLKGEKKALEIISRHKVAAIIVVALMPLEKTPMENMICPQPMDISRVILAARLTNRKTPLILGCARPIGKQKSETDILAIKAGINGIAYPSEEGYVFAKKNGFKISFSEMCCSLIYKEMDKAL